MYCFFNKFFFKVEIFGNLPIFCHTHLVAIQDFVDREILFDRCGKCPMLCLFFDFKWTISAVKSTAHVMLCFMRQHSAFLCGGLAFAAINDKEIVKERDCEIVFEFNIHNIYVQSFQIIIHTANGCVHVKMIAQNSFCTSADSTSWLSGVKYGWFDDGNQKAHINQFRKDLIEQRLSAVRTITEGRGLELTDKTLLYGARASLCATICKQKYTRAAGSQE